MLRQICQRGAFSVPEVSLSGDLVDLGRSADILFSSADEDTIWLELEAEECPLLQAAFLVDIEGGEAHWANLDEVQDVMQNMAERGVALFSGGPFGTPGVADFNYLNAERYGPRKALPVDDRHGRLFDLGKHGEFVFDALLNHQDRIILPADDKRALPEARGDRLRDHIEAWLHEISPGVQLDIAGVLIVTEN
ncbi:hypothetical protein [Pseudorhodobacter ferrugineus]|uniref:hypothetical protein n=1 Tax=Pseudorhodobacter ferrugineus TaxID=77008 RepID=UPI00067E59CA|nr:hypothetical protein [Pseudorhodobacter ferrugineus]